MLGVDIAGNLVEAANKRAAQKKLSNCRFQEGEASNLGCSIILARRPNASNGKSDALRQELEALFQSQNKCQTASATSIAATYLRVTVQVK